MVSRMPDQRPQPAVDVSVEIIIERPLAEVADYASDPTNAPDWYANIISADWQTEPPVAVGSEVAFIARFLGRELRYTYEVVEHTANRHVMRTAQGPFPMETTYRFASTDEGYTRVTLQNRGNPTGFSRLASPVMRIAMRRAMGQDLQVLKDRLEHT